MSVIDSIWKDVQVGDLGEVFTGRTPPSVRASCFGDVYPFITPSDMHQGKYVRKTARGLSNEGAALLDRIKLPSNSVCVSCIGWQMGEVVLTDRMSFTNQQINSIVPKKGYDPSFLYYSFRPRKQELLSLGSAIGARTPIINKSAFCNLKVRVPPLPMQQRIASILGAYDDLIDVNRRRISLLEEMTRRLFEEWFVRLRFPGYEGHSIEETEDGLAPTGWSYVGLHDVAEVTFGFPFKSSKFNTARDGVPVVRIRDIPEGRSQTWTEEPFDKRYTIADGDLLIGMDGIFHTAIWSGGPAALNQRVTRLRPLNCSTGWLLLSVLPKIKHLEATISGTTVAHLSARDLKNMRLLKPNSDTQASADKVFRPAYNAILNYAHQQQRLATSRDLLLPRLVSGELPVAAAERKLEAAE
jgi:type I restriction enzyme S subunit